MSSKTPLWVAGDLNAFFGLGTNVLVNLLVLTGLLKFVIKIPDAVLFGHILPAVGLMLFLGNMYYAWMAKRLANETGRDDVTALPSGPSVPHMFIVVFVIMLPITIQTKDPIKGWEAGLAWVFVEGIVLFAGAFIAPTIRKLTPRAALLGTLAGISITFISLRPAMEIFETPIIGMVSMVIILGAWYGGVRFPGNAPGGLVAIAVGTLLAWLSYAFGWGFGGMNPAAVQNSFGNIGFSIPLPAVGHVFSGFEFLAFIIVTAIPFGVYDFIEAMDNVESASAAGDEYSVKETLMAEGGISLVGTLFGSPFANAVYIGHPGWKSIGGRIGYSLATGTMVLVLTWLSIVSLLLDVIPVVAIIPILLYIGALIGAQAFQATPAKHAPAIIFAFVPHLAAWGKVLIDGALGAAGTNAGAVGFGKLAQNGVLYKGLESLGGGAIITGLIFAGIVVMLIDRKPNNAGIFCVIGAVLAFFGFIHGPAVGMAVSPMIALSYVFMAVICFGFTKMEIAPEES
ncbi:MAG: regulator [Rhodospirillaceae bacterium]|jgi:adenine/guanine/hypoxanthine permease|nr:regulator [Rhodospirillaceae bacterium]MBT7485106.1 regulator [Rhodospirillales bacterium]MBT4699580.1 regulator [Rhodospirillaceae bacterium]MBT5036269.1 regulator [Rhodospirillaceae bacterium]MBT6218918.1 regulator [Rhodospirillaceae bacterium]